MPYGSSSDKLARGAALDALYGSSHISTISDTIEMALFIGDPTGAGTELTSTGAYARVEIPNHSGNFPDCLSSNSYQKLVGVPIRFPVSTGAWSDIPDHWAFFDQDTGALMDSGAITGDAEVSTAGQILRFDTNTIIIGVS